MKAKMFLLPSCALCKFHVIEDQNAHGQITSDRRSKYVMVTGLSGVQFGL